MNVISPLSFLMLFFSLLSFLVKGLSILFFFSKNQFLVTLIFFILSLVWISFITAMICIFPTFYRLWALSGLLFLVSLGVRLYLCVCVCVCVQPYVTPCNPMDCSPSGSSVHGIFQARRLELPFPTLGIFLTSGIKSLASPALQVDSLPLSHLRSSEVSVRLLLLSHFSRVQLCVTPQTAAHQAPPSLGFSRQEHWSELPFPSPMHESENEREVAQ